MPTPTPLHIAMPTLASGEPRVGSSLVVRTVNGNAEHGDEARARGAGGDRGAPRPRVGHPAERRAAGKVMGGFRPSSAQPLARNAERTPGGHHGLPRFAFA